MDGLFLALIVIVFVALAFDYTNGFHDAANSIAVAVSTKALTPRTALALAAVMNLVGALLSTSVAKTVGAGIIDAPTGGEGLQLVFAALVGAIVWNLITWYYGLPSSSSHALIGGLVGAALAAAHSVQWMGVLDKVIIPMILSPLVGFGLGYLFMVILLWSFRKANAHKAQRGFRYAQIVSSATMAPMSAAKTSCRPSLPDGASMIPAPTVLATSVDSRAPTRFITAARASATRGVSALVETATAMELAASWKPLV